MVFDSRFAGMAIGGRSRSGTIYDLKYHVICITKYRCKVLRASIAERARRLSRQGSRGRAGVDFTKKWDNLKLYGSKERVEPLRCCSPMGPRTSGPWLVA